MEKLFNDDASCISCEVIGGAASSASKQATEMMERQANQLAPRIQMPAGSFRAKANEYITTLANTHFLVWSFVDTAKISTEESTGTTEERKSLCGDAFPGFLRKAVGLIALQEP